MKCHAALSKRKTLQKFTSAHSQIYKHFSGERHLVNRQIFKESHSESMTEWRSFMA